MILEQTLDGDWYAGQSFHFAVDTCENFKQYVTGPTNCVPNDQVLLNLTQFMVNTKVST